MSGLRSGFGHRVPWSDRASWEIDCYMWLPFAIGSSAPAMQSFPKLSGWPPRPRPASPRNWQLIRKAWSQDPTHILKGGSSWYLPRSRPSTPPDSAYVVQYSATTRTFSMSGYMMLCRTAEAAGSIQTQLRKAARYTKRTSRSWPICRQLLLLHGPVGGAGRFALFAFPLNSLLSRTPNAWSYCTTLMSAFSQYRGYMWDRGRV